MADARSTRKLAGIALVLAAALLAGCTQGGTTTTTTTTTTPTTTTPTSTSPTVPTVTTPTLPTVPSPPLPSGANDPYGLTTGSATGVYFAIGNGIQGAVRNTTNAGFTITETATSQGSVQNAQRLNADDHQLALMQNDVLFEAYNGEGRFEGAAITGLRAVASLYPELIQIVTLQSSNFANLDALAGKKVVVGAAGSGAAINALQIINATGLTVDVQYIDLSTGLERLKTGDVDAVFWTGGIPTGAITSLATTNPVKILPVEGANADLVRAEFPFLANATLPANTYGGQTMEVKTLAVRATLVARSDVHSDDIASLLKIIFEGTAVQQSHAQGQNIRLADAFLGVTGVPWHDGATYYYATKGMVTPS